MAGICFGAYCPYTLGTNQHGQLGAGTAGGYSGEPGRIEGGDFFEDLTQVAVTEVGMYGLTSTDGLYAWGSNQVQGIANRRADGIAPRPVGVRDTGQVTQLAAGARTVYVRSADGVVRAWRDNRDGALGDGTTEVRTSVVFVDLPVDVTAVAASRSTGHALRADGTVWAWGWNAEGQLGIGMAGGAGCHTDPSGPICVEVAPVLVPGLTGSRRSSAALAPPTRSRPTAPSCPGVTTATDSSARARPAVSRRRRASPR